MSDEPDFPVSSIDKLRLLPGDILVIRSATPVSAGLKARIDAIVRPMLPSDVHLLVLEPGIDLTLYRPVHPGAGS